MTPARHPEQRVLTPEATGDAEVASCLRSDAPLVVVEAPAGCGKTHQGSMYAAHAARSGSGRALVLTHTHAAASAFLSRAQSEAARVDVRTIDSLFVEIAAGYHTSLGLPEDVGRWAASGPRGFEKVRGLVAQLLEVFAGAGQSLARRYPVVIFDEHQDASVAQASLLDALLKAGAKVRVFGDPMQVIYPESDVSADWERWRHLCDRATKLARLNTPHRWASGSPELGAWVLRARDALQSGDRVDLRPPHPAGLEVHRADNLSSRWDGYRTTTEDGRAIRKLAALDEVLFLSAQTSTVGALRPYFGRRIPLWEGHGRDALTSLIRALETSPGDPSATAIAFVAFVQKVSVGFSNSQFGDRLVTEVEQGCRTFRRGMPAKLQGIAHSLLRNPDHRGVANALELLWNLSYEDGSFSAVKVDHCDEFWDAVRLREFEDAGSGMAEITHRRTWSRPIIPPRALSTIHKAKGLEAACVTIVPCDADHFRDRPKDRCTLYVALSRARERLCLVVPRRNPSPLLLVE